MQIVKPHWVSHNGCPIFCIDIHPDNSRFVTGGQGADSGRMTIWNLEPTLNEQVEFDENVPKMLCHLDGHAACVNCVRWSYSGKYLASGGDDNLVMVWSFAKYSQGSNTVFGSKGKANVESWRCTSTLRAHSGDILDLAWSPEDVWLATVSTDSTVIIWDANKLPEIITILKEHTGFVKGVSWDPIGKYLSTQSEDKSLRVWRTIDWQTEVVVKEPFKFSGTTYALRHDWSPDGQYLVAAHAMNNSGPTAQIVERDGWKYDKDYVGHRKAVNCVRFSSNIVLRRKKHSKKELQMCVCALGSRDNSVSVWLTGLLRPIVVMENLFAGPVLDVTWSSAGHNLLACSYDGTVALLKFSEEEIGKPLSRRQKEALYEKVYGTSSVGVRANYVIVENPVLEKLPEDAKPVVTAPPVVDSKPKQSVKPLGCSKQIETRTSDGKRRITPVFIASAPEVGDCPAPFKSTVAPSFSSSSEEASKIVIEKRDDIIVEPNVTSIGATNEDVKVRVESPIDKKDLQSTTDGSIATTIKSKSWKRSLESSLNAVVTKQPRFSDASQLPPVDVKSAESTKRLTVMCGDDTEQRSIVLPAMKMDKKTIVLIPGNRRALVSNESCSGIRGIISRVKVSSKDTDLWENAFGSLVTGCVGNKQYVVVTLENRNLYIIEAESGKHVMPPFVLSSKASHVLLTETYLMCIVSTGLLSLWDIVKFKVIISDQSLSSILPTQGNSVFINRSYISEQGIPMLALSNGKCYMFSIDLKTWLLLGDNSDPVTCNSLHKMKQNITRTNDRNDFSYPLLTLQTQSSNFSNTRILQNTDMNILCTYSFLEQQLSASLMLKSTQEFKHWLLTMVQFLLQQGEPRRLRVICEELLGSMNRDNKSDTVLGLSKHQLLKDVLKEIGNSVHAQRLYTEFSDQLVYLHENK